MPQPQTRVTVPWLHWVFLAIFVVVFVWASAFPVDRFTWLLETIPVIAGFIFLLATYRRFPLTTFLYAWTLWSAILVMVGGHYTYAQVPAGFWLRDIIGGTRNNYDKFAHFFLGVEVAVLARELYIRKSPLKRGGWLLFTVLTSVAAISAWYEVGEWLAGVLFGRDAKAFLSLQGDIFDTQSDIAIAFVGSIVALLLFRKIHDKALKKLAK